RRDGRLSLRLRRNLAGGRRHPFRGALRRLSGRRGRPRLYGRAQSRSARRNRPAVPRSDRSRIVATAPQQRAGGSHRMERTVSAPLETEEEINRRHNERMARRKAVRERMLATKTEERGLLIVHTGKGKGKSTAAFGMVLRCLGHGMRVGIVQFVKGVWSTGERTTLERFGDLVTCRAMGEGFTWDTQDRARDIVAARKAWETAKTMISDSSYQLVLLDELNIVLRYDYLPLEEVVGALKAKPRDLHVIVTGRNAR